MKKVLFFKDEVAVQEASKLFDEFFVKKYVEYFDDGSPLLCSDVPFILRGEPGWPMPALGIEYRSSETEASIRGFIACVQPEFVLD